MEQAAGLLEAEFAQVAAQAEAGRSAKPAAQMAFGLADGGGELLEHEAASRPGENVAIDPGEERIVVKTICFFRLHRPAFPGAEPGQERGEMELEQGGRFSGGPKAENFG